MGFNPRDDSASSPVESGPPKSPDKEPDSQSPNECFQLDPNQSPDNDSTIIASSQKIDYLLHSSPSGLTSTKQTKNLSSTAPKPSPNRGNLRLGLLNSL